MEFKAGDKVTVREWEDMEKEFGLILPVDIRIGEEIFVVEMRKDCGKIVTIEHVGKIGDALRYQIQEDCGHWLWV